MSRPSPCPRLAFEHMTTSRSSLFVAVLRAPLFGNASPRLYSRQPASAPVNVDNALAPGLRQRLDTAFFLAVLRALTFRQHSCGLVHATNRAPGQFLVRGQLCAAPSRFGKARNGLTSRHSSEHLDNASLRPFSCRPSSARPPARPDNACPGSISPAGKLGSPRASVRNFCFSAVVEKETLVCLRERTGDSNPLRRMSACWRIWALARLPVKVMRRSLIFRGALSKPPPQSPRASPYKTNNPGALEYLPTTYSRAPLYSNWGGTLRITLLHDETEESFLPMALPERHKHQCTTSCSGGAIGTDSTTASNCGGDKLASTPAQPAVERKESTHTHEAGLLIITKCWRLVVDASKKIREDEKEKKEKTYGGVQVTTTPPAGTTAYITTQHLAQGLSTKPSALPELSVSTHPDAKTTQHRDRQHKLRVLGVTTRPLAEEASQRIKCAARTTAASPVHKTTNPSPRHQELELEGSQNPAQRREKTSRNIVGGSIGQRKQQ
ncbi:hypothetical protein F4804DRAFT_330581 [Jackrogersella minutella]|nr:hypothetical protein F4804DRAFT_330581 [Jackrogersella minutella]